MSNPQIFWKSSHRLGVFFMLLYIVCFSWYFLMPTGRELHLQMFQMSFFGFDAMDIPSFFLGLFQVYVWAYIFKILWSVSGLCPICTKK